MKTTNKTTRDIKTTKTTNLKNLLKIMIVLGIISIISISGCLNVPTQKTEIHNAIITDKINNGEPADDMSEFEMETEIIYACAEVTSTPDNSQLTVRWHFEGSNRVTEESKNVECVNNWKCFNFTKPESGWEIGKYYVDFNNFHSDKAKANFHKEFSLIEKIEPKDDEPLQNETGESDIINKFASQEELNAYIKYSAESEISYGYYEGRTKEGWAMGKGMDGIVMENAEAAPGEAAHETTGTTPQGDAGSSASEYSETNIQVEGVDEADIVKNDGKYIYIVSGKKIAIIDAYPAKNAKILSEIEFDENPSEIFINKDKLIVFTREYKYNSRQKYYYGSYTKTTVTVYDIKNRENPELEREIKSDGEYFNSRMIGDYVYVVINEPIHYSPCPIYKGTEVDMECITQDIKVPEVMMNGKKINEKFPDIYYWDIPDRSYRFTTILSLDTQDSDAKPDKKFFVMSTAQNMFVSPENIYITRTKWVSEQELRETVYEKVVIPNLPNDARDEITEIEDSDKSIYIKKFEITLVIKNYFVNLNDKEMNEFREKINDEMQKLRKEFEKTREQTVINKIGIKHGRITPKESGSVPGTILNQFSMDEFNKNFRIATTTQKHGSKQANHLFVLNSDMKIIGKIEDIAPGESIYSVRFMGKKAYMVTFKRVDPLFVIDLSNPEKPKLVGKLKIPGYSDYLHPYDENHLIGIGKEVDESIDADKVHSDSAVYYTAIQGVKLAIFDVTDINHPVEMYKEVIGDRGTESEATEDHKAFLFDREKNLLVIPIRLAEISDAQKKSKDWQRMEGEFTFQGAYVYDISLDDGFKLRGRVTHLDDPETLMKSGYYFSSPYSVKRSLYMDDVLYTISNKKVKMNDLESVEEINEVELDYEEGYDDGGRYWRG